MKFLTFKFFRNKILKKKQISSALTSYFVHSKYAVRTFESNNLAIDNKLSEGIKLLMQSPIVFICSTTFGIDPFVVCTSFY